MPKAGLGMAERSGRNPTSSLDLTAARRYGTPNIRAGNGSFRLSYVEITESIMSRRCEFTGKGWLSGNQVSHANNKTKTRFMPNLCDVTLMSDALGNSYSFRISAHALKSVEHRGGLDSYLLKAKNDELSIKARRIKRAISKKLDVEKAA